MKNHYSTAIFLFAVIVKTVKQKYIFYKIRQPIKLIIRSLFLQVFIVNNHLV